MGMWELKKNPFKGKDENLKNIYELFIVGEVTCFLEIDNLEKKSK